MALRRGRRAALAAAGLTAAVAGGAVWACEPWRRPAPPGPGWSRAPEVPLPRGEVATAAGEREIVVLGGLAGSGQATARVDILEPDTGRWRPGPPLPSALNHAAAAALGGRVYVAGGSEQFGMPPRRDAYALDLPGGRAWEHLPPLPSGRWAAGMAGVAGRLFVVGGIGSGGEASPATLAYDPAAGRWEQRPPPPTAREHLGVAAAGDLVYAAGGRWDGRNLASVEAYDPAADRWRPLAPLPTPRSGLGLAAIQAGGRWFLVAAGGEDPNLPGRVYADVEVLDIAAGAWRRVAPLPTPRHGLGGAGHGGRAYFLAGATFPGLRSVLGWSGAVEVYQVDPRL